MYACQCLRGQSPQKKYVLGQFLLLSQQWSDEIDQHVDTMNSGSWSNLVISNWRISIQSWPYPLPTADQFRCQNWCKSNKYEKERASRPKETIWQQNEREWNHTWWLRALTITCPNMFPPRPKGKDTRQILFVRQALFHHCSDNRNELWNWTVGFPPLRLILTKIELEHPVQLLGIDRRGWHQISPCSFITIARPGTISRAILVMNIPPNNSSWI